MLQKVRIIVRNTSNRNCAKIDFLQKTQWTHIFISLTKTVIFEIFLCTGMVVDSL